MLVDALKHLEQFPCDLAELLHPRVVLATLKPYQWGRAWVFRIEGVPWVKDAGSFLMAPRIAYPGLVRSKVEALEVLRIVRGIDPKPERWSRKYHQPGHGGSAINAPEETR